MRRGRLPADRRGRVVVFLVGEHVADDPDLDVYRNLYRLPDLAE